MSKEKTKSPICPIIEAILEIDCDLPPSRSIHELEGAARDSYGERYPEVEIRGLEQHKLHMKGQTPEKLTVQKEVEGYRFWSEDRKQLVQIRREGFSFNRLEPYSSLDNYLEEIKDLFHRYVVFAEPKNTRLVRLRYINKILIPLVEGKADLDEYLAFGPQSPDQESLAFLDFLHRYSLVEKSTRNLANIVLATQDVESGFLPVILDTTAIALHEADPRDWASIEKRIEELRKMKNHIFKRTVTKKCLKQYQQQTV